MTKYLFCLLLLYSCGSPLRYYYDAISKMGLIPYSMPNQQLGVGTFIAKSQKNAEVYSPGDICLGELSDEQMERLIHKIALNISRGGALSGVTLQISVSYQYQADIKMSGLVIEYIDRDVFSEVFNTTFSTRCLNSMKRAPFVVAALSAEHLEYSFYKEVAYGVNATVYKPIELSPEKIQALFNGELNMDYIIKDKTTLVIDSPTYIGVIIGKVNEAGMITEIAFKRANRYEKKNLEQYIQSLLQ